MVKIGETLYVSAVEVIDRNAGRGIGHLFEIDMGGHLLADLRMGEGAIYHPGGIDYDGRSIWVPVAEYRPDSRSIVYRVDPQTMKAAEAFRVDDHIGAIVHNTDDRTLHGVSWGSRRFYRWTVEGVSKGRTLNSSHYVDYQDCKYVGGRQMMCTGVTEMRASADAAAVQARRHRVDRSARRPSAAPGAGSAVDHAGLDMTHNPVGSNRGRPGCAAISCRKTIDPRSTSTTSTRGKAPRGPAAWT